MLLKKAKKAKKAREAVEPDEGLGQEVVVGRGGWKKIKVGAREWSHAAARESRNG